MILKECSSTQLHPWTYTKSAPKAAEEISLSLVKRLARRYQMKHKVRRGEGGWGDKKVCGVQVRGGE